jgi:hypothetical protein
MAITPFPHQDPRYGFFKTSAEDVEWAGEFALDTMTYVGVVRCSKAFGLSSVVRKHWVWAKDELEAFMRLNARRNANI